MGNFGQSYPKETTDRDVLHLESYLRERGLENYDDHEAVIAHAREYFTNYPDTDIEEIVAALYAKEQDAANHADQHADREIK